MKGGGIFIATSCSNFEFRSCSFDRNNAGDASAIYYISDTSNSLEVDETINDEIDHDLYFVDCHFYFNMALHIVDCTFLSNVAKGNGSAIGVFLKTREPRNPIEISGFKFTKNIANKNENQENGGAIYYEQIKTSSFEQSKNFLFKVTDCEFCGNQASCFGGSIYIGNENVELFKQI